MKKILSIALSALTAASCVLCAGISASADTTVYSSAIEDVKAACPYEGESGGFLFDVDGNGEKELVTYSNVQGASVPMCVANVFTVKNNKVKRLVKNKKLFDEVGGPSGFIATAKKGRKNYVVCSGETGTTGGAPGEIMNRNGTINFYRIKGAKVASKIKVSYSIRFKRSSSKVKVVKAKIKINGKKKSYSKFKKWYKSFKFANVKKNKGGILGVTYSNNIDSFSALLEKI